MKLLHLTFHFEYTDPIEQILLRHGIGHFVRHPMIEGLDRDGRHYGTQAFPGNVSVIQAQVEEEKLEGLLSSLRQFREQKEAHRHIEALVLPVERRL